MYLRSANIKNPQDKHKVLVFESCKIVEKLIEDMEKVPYHGSDFTHGITTTKIKKVDRSNVDNEKDLNVHKSVIKLKKNEFHDENKNEKPKRRRRRKSKS